MKSKTYYYIDINLATKEIVEWGTTLYATHTGNTDDPEIHRVFMTKGQYNKLISKIEIG